MKQHVFSLNADGAGHYYSECYNLPAEPIYSEGNLHPYQGILEVDGKLIELLIEGDSYSKPKITAFWPTEDTPEGSDDYEDYKCLTYWEVNSAEEASEFVESLIRKYYGKIDEIQSLLQDEGFEY